MGWHIAAYLAHACCRKQRVVVLLLPLQTYHYNLDTGACHDPLRLRYSHHVRKPLDLAAMQVCCGFWGVDISIHDSWGLGRGSQHTLFRRPPSARMMVLGVGVGVISTH